MSECAGTVHVMCQSVRMRNANMDTYLHLSHLPSTSIFSSAFQAMNVDLRKLSSLSVVQLSASHHAIC